MPQNPLTKTDEKIIRAILKYENKGATQSNIEALTGLKQAQISRRTQYLERQGILIGLGKRPKIYLVCPTQTKKEATALYYCYCPRCGRKSLYREGQVQKKCGRCVKVFYITGKTSEKEKYKPCEYQL